jgi:thiol-disulfide isomerase/thioredoxin
MGSLTDATKETFEELVSSGLVLVDVWAKSCRPCVRLAPRVAEIAAELPELDVVKLDATKARRLCMAYQVRGLPTFLLFRDGQEVARLTDTSLTPAGLDKWLAAQLGDEHGEED